MAWMRQLKQKRCTLRKVAQDIIAVLVNSMKQTNQKCQVNKRTNNWCDRAINPALLRLLNMKTETKLNQQQHNFHTLWGMSYRYFHLNSFKLINGLFWDIDGAPDKHLTAIMWRLIFSLCCYTGCRCRNYCLTWWMLWVIKVYSQSFGWMTQVDKIWVILIQVYPGLIHRNISIFQKTLTGKGELETWLINS